MGVFSRNRSWRGGVELSKNKDQNPALAAAEEAMNKIYDCLNRGNSFVLEAGAGAGKTYSLIKTLEYLISKRGNNLLRNNQQIACITFTNVACDEIREELSDHPAVLVSTIHSFCWSLIKHFQLILWEKLHHLPKWEERLAAVTIKHPVKIDYELGYREVDNEKILLGHDDVILLTIQLMENIKFRRIISSRYPILFIDEYQDTNKAFADALLKYFLEEKSNMIVGFFGDSWQKIYDNGCGTIVNKNLIRIDKRSNFRSCKTIVDVLNQIRPELKQVVKDPNSTGYVKVFHTNDWKGKRLEDKNWKDDLPSEVARNAVDVTEEILTKDGWDFSPERTKILMLTHKLLAHEQGYSGIENVFQGRSEFFVKLEDPHLHFLVKTVEPVCVAFENKKYGDMFNLLERRTPGIRSIDDKKIWHEDMATLLRLRSEGTIGDVIDHLLKTKRPRLPSIVEEREQELLKYDPKNDDEKIESMERLRKLKEVPYQEIVQLSQFIEEKTPFSTKHGVKGAEFENVLVVIRRGWNRYDFNKFLEYSQSPESIPDKKQDFYERNRNLFYVAVSRPKKRLAVLFTHKLSDKALVTLEQWFGKENIQSIGYLI